MAQEDDKELYDTSDLSDLAKISLPFKIEEVRPQCVACVRRQIKKFQNATDEFGKSLKNRFIVDCAGVPKDPIDLKLKPLFSAEEWKQANELMDPVLWAQKWLTHPNGDPWIPRHYQEEVMRCSSARKALRIARRSGKTELVSVSITFLATTKDNQRIVVAAPQKIHAEEIFKRIRSFLYRNPLLATSVEKDISSPIYEIVLKNGSSIKGFALGTRGKTEGMSVRGSSADHIFAEELAYIDEQAVVGGLFPILQTTGRVTFTGFGTPTGFKSIYYKICEDDPRYREFFYSYRVLPHWREVEKDKINYTESQWLQELEAQWGFSEEGVYRPAYVERSLRSYLYKDQSPTYGWRYSIGADWNEKHGAELVVLGQNISGNYFQVVEAVSVGSSEFTQLNGVQALVDLNKKWRPSIIYADSGNGSSNYELLRKMSYEERRKGGDPDTARLLDILRKYDSGASILSKDPVTREERKVPAKPFMVNASIRAFEQDRMRISSADKELEKQIRNYIIERISPTGTPVYGGLDGRVKDHKLDALNLAIVGFYIEFGWMKQSDPIVAALSSLSPRQKVSNNVESNRSRDLGDNRTNLQTKLESPAMELFGAHLPARVSPNQMVGSSRPGWEYDMEGIEEEKRQQRLRKKKRGRLGIRSNI